MRPVKSRVLSVNEKTFREVYAITSLIPKNVRIIENIPNRQ